MEEEVLKGMGVVLDNESDILARVLQQKQEEKATLLEKRKRKAEETRIGSIAHSIIENVDLVSTGEQELDQEIGELFAKRQSRGIVQLGYSEVSQQGASSSSNNVSNILYPTERNDKVVRSDALNLLLLEAAHKAKKMDLEDGEIEESAESEKEATETEPESGQEVEQEVEPISSVEPIVSSSLSKKRPVPNTSVSANKKRTAKPTATQSSSSSSSAGKNAKITVTCPVCNRSFDTKEAEADNFLSQHMDRCNRRAPARRVNYDENHHIEEVLGADEEFEFNFDEEEGMEYDLNFEDEFQPEEEESNSVQGDEEEEELLGTDDEEAAAAAKKKANTNKKTNKRKPTKKPTLKKASKGSKKKLTSVTTSSSLSEMEDLSLSYAELGDDWEDDHYLQRIAAIDPQRLEVIDTDHNSKTYSASWSKLYEYQQVGCKWFYGLYNDGVGGILADEMGLGKTAQVCCHFMNLTLMNAHLDPGSTGAYLIVCPPTVLQHWLNEMYHWAPTMRVMILHSVSTVGKLVSTLSPKDMSKYIRAVRRSRHSKAIVVITTYEGVRKHAECLTSLEWTAVCLDEGQKIRNPFADITTVCKQLPSFHRLLLSGTPIQNSLRELWSLFDFIYPGRLGTLSVFEQEYAHPIRLGGYSNATKLQYEIAIRCAAMLQRIVKPYLLRRKKVDLIAVTQLPAKTEQILFCQISDQQRKVYRQIVDSDEVAKVLSFRTAAFRAINTLRKLCNHPALVYQNGAIVWTVDKAMAKAESKGNRGNKSSLSTVDSEDEDPSLETLLAKEGSGNISWADSGKMLVLSKILPLWNSEGHKVLIFCQTTSMLDLLQGMLDEMRFNYLRLDGGTPIYKRPEIIDKYNNDPKMFAMLLTTRTGGVGISLTSANRVILFDPDWNPMTDIQARERAWRLGQTREVVIYRLITKGTIEEKIYQRQIFKMLISNRVLENTKQKGLFAAGQLRELFYLPEDARDESEPKTSESSAVNFLPKEGNIDLNQESATTSSSIEQIEGIETAPFIEEDDEGQDKAETNTGENAKDHLLLRALFNGEAISAVYDHEVVEPGVLTVVKAKNPTLEHRADQVAETALQRLQSSARSFQPAPAMNAMGGNLSSTNQSSSSSALLARIRGQQKVATQEEEQIQQEATNFQERMRATFVAEVPEASVSQLRFGVANNIRERLLGLFNSAPGNSLPTKVIIGHFRDLGDHYAPMFKRTLKTIATFKEGKWTLKK